MTKRPVRITDRSEITDYTPLRLDVAAALAFPGGGMTVTGLRRERDAGRLVTETVADKEYTTLHYITQMREACQGLRRAPGYGCKPMDAAAREANLEAAQANLMRTLNRLRSEHSKLPAGQKSPLKR